MKSEKLLLVLGTITLLGLLIREHRKKKCSGVLRVGWYERTSYLGKDVSVKVIPEDLYPVITLDGLDWKLRHRFHPICLPIGWTSLVMEGTLEDETKMEATIQTPIGEVKQWIWIELIREG